MLFGYKLRLYHYFRNINLDLILLLHFSRLGINIHQANEEETDSNIEIIHTNNCYWALQDLLKI